MLILNTSWIALSTVNKRPVKKERKLGTSEGVKSPRRPCSFVLLASFSNQDALEWIAFVIVAQLSRGLRWNVIEGVCVYLSLSLWIQLNLEYIRTLKGFTETMWGESDVISISLNIRVCVCVCWFTNSNEFCHLWIQFNEQMYFTRSCWTSIFFFRSIERKLSSNFKGFSVLIYLN